MKVEQAEKAGLMALEITDLRNILNFDIYPDSYIRVNTLEDGALGNKLDMWRKIPLTYDEVVPLLQNKLEDLLNELEGL